MNSTILTPSWPAPNNVQACMTLRNTPDDYLQQLPATPNWLKQVHGINTVCVDNLTAEIPVADAAYSFSPNKICVVRTADCLPVLLCDKQGTQVAAIHAGWRGLAAGVIAATLSNLTAKPAKILAWLGPAIGPQVFEVGHDVLENFLTNGWQQAQLDLAFVPQVNNKYLADLYYLARIELQQAGVLAENIYATEACTYSDPQRFYSYRRSAETARMASLIWLK